MRSYVAAAALVAAFACHPAAAQEAVKIGFISTFSGPSGSLGQELLDGFNLGIQSVGGTLGGVPVEIIQGDDQAEPDVGRQLADRMIERDRVQIITGINFSNVMLAVARPALDAGLFVFSINAGPSQYAGAQCHPHYFAASHQNDTAPEAMGLYLSQQGVANAYIMAPNYPAGHDFLEGFKRTFTGTISGEVYTAFGQLDYAAEIAQLRAAAPAAVFFFYPGGMGINFVKQYAQAELTAQIPLYGPSFSLDQTVLPGMGADALGAHASTYWPEDSDNPAAQKFIADFQAAYGRRPSPNAAQAYDGARILDAAIRAVNGDLSNADAFQAALDNVQFDSVRGKFAFNTNHHPIQDFYLAEIVADDQGRPYQSGKELIVADYQDHYVAECTMGR